MDPTSFPPPRWQLLLLAGGTLFFTVLGVVAAGSDTVFWRWTGLTLTAAFATATAVLLARALRPGPTVVVATEGLTDRTTLAATGLVRWEEIAAVRKRELGRGLGRERLLEIVLLRPDEFRARPRSRTRRLADRYRALIKQPEVTIPGSMVAAPLAAVVATMRRHQPDLTVLELPPPRPGLFSRLGRSKAHPPPKQHPDLPHW